MNTLYLDQCQFASRCLFLRTYLNINGETYDCIVEIQHDHPATTWHTKVFRIFDKATRKLLCEFNSHAIEPLGDSRQLFQINGVTESGSTAILVVPNFPVDDDDDDD